MKKPVILSIFTILITYSLAVSAFPWGSLKDCNSSKLTEPQKNRALKLMGDISNYHGCPQSIKKCVEKGKNQTALFAGGMICRMILDGAGDARIKKAVEERGKSLHPFTANKFNHRASLCTGTISASTVVIDVFSDFKCPYCRKILPVVKDLGKKRSNVVVCFRHFPTLTHGKHAITSSLAAEAAANQGKFWDYHDLLYANHTKDAQSDYESFAEKLGLDLAKFRKDMASRAVRKVVSADKGEGLKAQVRGTPTIFIDGKMFTMKYTLELFLSIIDEQTMLRTGKK